MKKLHNEGFEEENRLCDINDVTIRMDLPQEERIKDYLRQIKNPYCFRCGDIIVEVEYGADGLSIDDCLKEYLQNLI